MSETEKLARLIRLSLTAVVGLGLLVVAVLGITAGVRWTWDAVTTSSGEKLASCVEKLSEGKSKVGQLVAQADCKEADGDVERAQEIRLRKEIEAVEAAAAHRAQAAAEAAEEAAAKERVSEMFKEAGEKCDHLPAGSTQRFDCAMENLPLSSR